MTFSELIEKVLSESQSYMTYYEIWTYAEKKGYDKELNKNIGQTPWKSISSIITTNLTKGDSSIYKVLGSSRPRKITLRQLENVKIPGENNIGINVKSNDKKKNKKEEEELHPYLTSFASNDFGVKCKSINDHVSTGKKKGHAGKLEWLHPDIVGFYYNTDRQNTVLICVFSSEYLKLNCIHLSLKSVCHGVIIKKNTTKLCQIHLGRM